MWIFLAALIVCFTIVVIFRMYMDLRRQDQQYNRVMRSDQRDYERYIDVRSKENPQPALPDFSKAIATPSMNIDAYDMALEAVRYWKHDELPTIPQPLTGAQLEALKRTYADNDYDRFIAMQKYYAHKRRTL